MPPKPIFRHIMERPFFRWAAITYIAIAAIGVAVSFFVSFNDSLIRSDHELTMVGIHQQDTATRLDVVVEQVESLQKLLPTLQMDTQKSEELRQTIVAIQELQQSPDFSLLDRFSKIEKATAKLDTELHELKSALNPANPGGILSILRLGDKFELFDHQLVTLQREISQLRENLHRNINENYQRTKDHIDTMKWIVGSIVLLLVPPLLGSIASLYPLRKKQAEPDTPTSV